MKQKPYEFTGTLNEVGRVQTFQSGFQKRTFTVVQDPDDKYPFEVPFELTKSKNANNLALLDKFVTGQTVTVKFYLNSFKGTKGFFVSLKCVEIADATGSEVSEVVDLIKSGKSDTPTAESPATDATDDDMPF